MNETQNFSRIFAERLTLGIICAIFLFTLSSCGTVSQQKGAGLGTEAFAASKPTVTISPAVVEYKPNVKVLISGSGFEPNQELKLHIFMGGVISNIGPLMKPKPVPNEFGAFASVWKLRREISKKLLQPLPMVYTLSVLDSNYNVLCTAPLVFEAKK